MLKNKLYLAAGLILLISLSSCGIFHKGCGCPPISMIKLAPLAVLNLT